VIGRLSLRADGERMLAARYPTSTSILLVGVAAVAGLFLFARPEYHPLYESETIDMSQRYNHTAVAVRAAFAREGIQLTEGTATGGGVSGIRRLVTGRSPGAETSPYVYVAGPNAKVSWGSKFPPAYEERFDNLLVHYGGTDAHVLAKVKAAASALRLPSSRAIYPDRQPEPVS
jgi:hypothetical protein